LKKRQPEDQAIDECILQTVTVKKPESIAELITLVQKEFHYSDKEILNRIVTLQNEGKIALKKEPVAITKLSTYLASRKALWYWATLAFTAVTAALVLEAPESVSAIADIRIIFGTFFVLLMPGYVLVRALFPARRPDAVERMGLSIGLSMALVSLDAFILNFTPWKITLSSIVGTLALLIIILATCAFLNGLRHGAAI
jgi:hypothetical protein